MSAQIFKIGEFHGIQITGIASTEDTRITAIYLDTPTRRRNYGDTEEPGQLTARQTILLGHLLTDLGESMLAGDLRRDANKSFT